MRLDDRDIKILTILQCEGRITKTELAARVNLSPSPCWERLKKLENAGIIEGYRAKISSQKLGSFSVIIMEVELDNHQAEDFTRFENAIQNIPEIVECLAVGGGLDYILKFMCKDLTAYQALVDDMLKANIGLKRYYTYAVTKPIKTSAIPPLEIL
jgi:Lrp/AsnC family transcriptional regulator of ectoine degradation